MSTPCTHEELVDSLVVLWPKACAEKNCNEDDFTPIADGLMLRLFYSPPQPEEKIEAARNTIRHLFDLLEGDGYEIRRIGSHSAEVLGRN